MCTWLGIQSDLDPKRKRILRRRLDDLRQILPTLSDPTERHYCSALGDCGHAVLAAQQNP